MDRLSSLAAFVKAVDLGGFAPAARHMRLSSVMVGKHVAALERQLGTRLLHRTTRRLTLTEAGRSLHERAVLILRDYDDATRAIASYQEEPQGLLRITVPIAFAEILSGTLARYSRGFPKVRLDVICDDRVLDLVENGFDLALRVGRMPDSSLIARKLAPMPVVLCASPDYLARRGAPSSLDDLQNHDCIAYEYQWSGANWAFGRADKEGEILVPVANPRYRSNNLVIQRVLALAGNGIALLPQFAVQKDLAAGTLVTLLEHIPAAERWLNAVYTPGRQAPSGLRALVDHFVEQFREVQIEPFGVDNANA